MTARKVDLNRPVFVIEQMKDCHSHKWHTRFDETKYEEFSRNVSSIITEHVPDAVILINQIPKKWADHDQYCQLIPDDENCDVYAMIPRLGGFEVSTVQKGACTLIYSKILAGMWPHYKSLGAKVGRYMEAVKANKNMKEVQAEFNFDPTKVTRQSRGHTASGGSR